MAEVGVVRDPEVFDIRYCHLVIGGREMTDIHSDGYGITPESEISLIPGLAGEAGFSIDPSTAATATVTLLAPSADNEYLWEIYRNQRAGVQGPVTVEISVDAAKVDALGFKTRTMVYAMIQKPSAFATAGKDSPGFEFTFTGYGYTQS